MPITTLEGPPRSGKSHYSVKYRLLHFIKQKVVTVTNVDGINIEELANYLKLPIEEVEPYVILLTMPEMQQLSEKQKLLYDPDLCPDAVLQPGYHLLVDEAWSLWPADRSFTQIEKTFFPYHGHYKDDRGIVTEITLATQAMTQLNRGIRPLVQERIVFEKLTKLGMANRFQYKVFSGNARRYHVDKIEKYDDKIFPLYASTSGGGDFTTDTSKKSSIFSSLIFKVVLAFLILAPFLVMQVMNKLDSGFGAVKSTDKASNDTTSTTGSTPSLQSTPPSTIATSSSGWRLVAMYNKSGQPVALLTDNAGKFRSALITSQTVGFSNDVTVSIGFSTDKSTPYTGSAPTYLNGAK